jgi:predicted small lipoprotein YifL
MSRSLTLVTVLLCATLAVSACGKRGALEAPLGDDGKPIPGQAKKGNGTSGKTTKDKEGYYHAKPADDTEHRPFILDGLLR